MFRRVLVGAPRATSTLGLHDIPETGALFKCGTTSQPGCREVVLDTAGECQARRGGVARSCLLRGGDHTL